LSDSPCQHAILLSHTKFRGNRTIGQWFMAKKAIFKMAAAAVLNFKNCNFWSRDCHWFNICFSVPNFIKIGWFFSEIWWFSDLQNGGCPPSWICYDVTILHRRTHFRCANIVVKFLVDRFRSFRDTCNIVRQPFGYGNFGVAHALYHVTLSRGVQNNRPYEFFDPYLPIHYATFTCLRWRLRGVLRGASPLLSDF